MGKFIILGFCFLVNNLIAQTVSVRHYSTHTDFICSGNDRNRIILFISSSASYIESIADLTNVKPTWSGGDDRIYETELENAPKFNIKIIHPNPQNLKYTYKLDPQWPHRTLLVIYDCSSLYPCQYK